MTAMAANDEEKMAAGTNESTDETTAVPTEPLPASSPAADGGRPRGSAIAGVLTAVLVIMGIGMVVAQIVSGANGRPGPGALTVGAQVAGAVVGVACYRVGVVGPRRGAVRVAALVCQPVVTVLLLWFCWFSA